MTISVTVKCLLIRGYDLVTCCVAAKCHMTDVWFLKLLLLLHLVSEDVGIPLAYSISESRLL